MTHNERCEYARDPHCECSCGGRLHGVKSEKEGGLNSTIGERFMTTALGGEVEKGMKEVLGKKFKCTCGQPIIIGAIKGYPHDGGSADVDGKKWWLYVNCPKCNQDWSLWKLAGRIEVKMAGQTKFEEEGDGLAPTLHEV